MTQGQLFDAPLRSGASFSPCRVYRYTLWRSWGVGDYCNFIMLNPSTATETANDPTVERCQRRAKSWGYGGLIVTNLFAFRATDPRAMKAALDPVGPDNDDAIRESAGQSKIIICAWGNHGGFRSRSQDVTYRLNYLYPHKLHTLRLCASGEPQHPLYLPYSLTPIRW